jgi:hypothetical protein
VKSIITRLSGVTFGGAQENIKTFVNEDIGSYALVREPDNPHGPNAIRVALFGRITWGMCLSISQRNLLLLWIPEGTSWPFS